MDKKLKIAEIASRTGMSASTVSRVLAGKANTSDKARRAVLTCARDMGVLEGIAAGRMLLNSLVVFAPQRAFDDFSVSLAVGNQVLLMAKQGQMASMNGCGGASQLWSTLTWDEKTYLWLYEHRWGVWAGVVLTLLSLAKKWRERRLRRAAQT